MMKYVLWIIQILLALLFLFAGGMKLVVPAETLQSMGSPNQILFPGWFLKFIGLCEVLGALGLIFPVLLGIKPRLTGLAAVGLAILMVGAVAVSIAGDGILAGIVPLIIGLLLVFVAYGRMKPAAQTGS